MNINFDLLIIDYIIIVITIFFALFGFWKGFINSIFGLLTWIGSVFITIYTYEYLSNYLNNILLNINFFSRFEQFVSLLSILVSIPLIFLISLFVLKRIRKLLNSDLDKQILGLIIDKLFGAIYGIVFSYAIYSTCLYFTNDSNLRMLVSTNKYLIENSNILSNISEYNNKILEIYLSDDE